MNVYMVKKLIMVCINVTENSVITEHKSFILPGTLFIASDTATLPIPSGENVKVEDFYEKIEKPE